jgi:hypothetical protein
MCQCELEVVDDKTIISWLWLQCLSYVNAMVGTCWKEGCGLRGPQVGERRWWGQAEAKWMIIGGFAATESRL